MADKKYTGEDLVIGFTEQAAEQVRADPELAGVVSDLMAMFRQAQQSFHDGKYASFEEALAALGVKATKLDIDGDDE